MAIVSFKHQFIFIKTHKTAGTSIELELGRRVEQDAIVTEIFPPEPGHEPRNFKRGLFRKKYFNHMPAVRVRDYLGRKTFDRMFKFSIEREPVAKCISHFHMRRNSSFHLDKTNPELSWDDYCAQGKFPINTNSYSEVVNGVRVRLVDEVIPYEELQEGLDRVSQRVGLEPFRIEAKAKADYSAKRIVHKDEVTPDQRRIIYDAFAECLALSGLEDYYGNAA